MATGDLTGDGIPDIITGTGPGTAPHVKVFDGLTGLELFGFLPYGSAFTGGVFVAAGDVNGDGIADLITGTDAGVAAQVEVFSGRTLQLLGILLPYGGFPGGARVAAGDVNGDGFADVITGAGPGAGPDVRVFDGRTGAIRAAFLAFGPAYPGGVYVAAGDLDGDGFADIITGAGTVAHVNVFSGRTGVDMASFLTPDVSSGAGLVTSAAPGPSGVRVAAVDIDGDGLADLLTGTGPDGGGVVRKFKGTTLQELDNFFAYGSPIFGGLFLGGS